MITLELSHVFETAKREIENGADPVETLRGAMLGALHAAKRNKDEIEHGITALEEVEVPIGHLGDWRA